MSSRENSNQNKIINSDHEHSSSWGVYEHYGYCIYGHCRCCLSQKKITGSLPVNDNNQTCLTCDQSLKENTTVAGTLLH